MSPNLFARMWRPAIGWVCVFALGFTYIGHPLLLWANALWFPSVRPPAIGNGEMLYELVLGILGLGGLRTFEKVKGVT